MNDNASLDYLLPRKENNNEFLSIEQLSFEIVQIVSPLKFGKSIRITFKMRQTEQ